MADKHVEPAEVRRVISLAIGAAGPADDIVVWRARVASFVTEIAEMLEEQSSIYHTTHGVMTARVFRATYHGYSYEERTTRCLVRLEAFSQRSGREGTEEARTERTDEIAGQVMRRKLEAIPVGTEVRAYITMDTLPNGDKARCLVNISPLSAADQSAGDATTPAAPPDPPREARPPEPEAATSGSGRSEAARLLEAEGMVAEVQTGPSGGATLDDIIKRLRAAGKYADFSKRAFQEAGVPNVNAELTPDEANKLRKISEELLS